MNNKLSWRDALKQINDNRVKEGGKYTIPKKGTPEYASVRKLMGDDVDAVPLQPNKTITGQEPPGKSTGKPRAPSKSRTPKQKQEPPFPSKEKPLWSDEPKPKSKKSKQNVLQEFELNDKQELVQVNEKPSEEKIKKSKSKKKSVATQTEPVSPKPSDFVLELQ